MTDSDLPSTDKDRPKFRRVEQRRKFALAKFYGQGSDGTWEMEEIAEYLNVSEATVENYIYDTEMGEQVREVFPAAEERMKMDIVLEKKKRLDKLREMFDAKLQEKDISVTGYKINTVKGEPNFENIEGFKSPEEEGMSDVIRLDAPLAENFEERTKLDGEARAILREIRKHENDIRDMLSLDQPDEVKTEHEGDAMVEQKIYNIQGSSNDEMPEARVVDVEAERVESSMDIDDVGEE
jgi:hypothetical protein